MKPAKIISSLLLSCLLLSSCGSDKDKHSHSYDDWETVTKATCTTEGKKERFCDCGERQTRKIAPLDHTFNKNGICTVCSATSSAQGGNSQNGENSGNTDENGGNNNENDINNSGWTNPDWNDTVDTDFIGGETINYGSSVGERCPDHTLDTIDGLGKVNVKAYIDIIVVINFWGTWCSPAKSELSALNAIADDYYGDVVVIAVHSVFNHSSKAEAPSYIQNNYSESKILFAYDQPLNAYTDMYFDLLGGTDSYPRTLVVDKDGIITFTHDGMLAYDQLKQEIDKIMDDQAELDDDIVFP